MPLNKNKTTTYSYHSCSIHPLIAVENSLPQERKKAYYPKPVKIHSRTRTIILVLAVHPRLQTLGGEPGSGEKTGDETHSRTRDAQDRRKPGRTRIRAIHRPARDGKKTAVTPRARKLNAPAAGAPRDREKSFETDEVSRTARARIYARGLRVVHSEARAERPWPPPGATRDCRNSRARIPRGFRPEKHSSTFGGNF